MHFEKAKASNCIDGEARSTGITGVPVNPLAQPITPEQLRQRTCTELLRQASIRRGLLDAGDPASNDGVITAAASRAIEDLLERELQLPDPSEDACRRYHAADPTRYRMEERVRVRHILFAVTPGVNVVALRKRAEACLLDLRCHDDQVRGGFGQLASELSNCPSGEQGGELGWLSASDCAPEFARELFGRVEIGVLPRLVPSRFGLHLIEVLARDAGLAQPFEAVRGAVAMALRQQAYVAALRQYLQQLARKALVVGVDLDAVDAPVAQ